MHLALVQVTRHLGSTASASTPAANTGATAVIKPGAPDRKTSTSFARAIGIGSWTMHYWNVEFDYVP